MTTPSTEFANPSGGPIRYGIGRDLFRGPWFNGFDAAISKVFTLTERVKLQLRGDAINALNHSKFRRH